MAELRAVEVSLVSLPRFASALEHRGDRLCARLFSRAELAYADSASGRHRLPRLAARFAAKCAARKALRRIGVPAAALRDCEVVRSEDGDPGLQLPRTPAGVAFHLSLSHDADFAVASLFVESEQARAAC